MRTARPVLGENSHYYHTCQERLLRLYDAVSLVHEPHAAIPPPDAHLFSEEEFPGYSTGTLVMVREGVTRVQRKQQSSLCYTHAGAVVQHGAISHTLQRNGTLVEHGVLDVALYIAKHFTAAELEAHVFQNSGGSSLEFLEAIIQPGSIVSATDPSNFEGHLQLYGPGLVACFKVYTDFMNPNVHYHHGMPSGSIIGKHAMVLVGARTDDAGNRFFLLQNWYVGV